MSVKEEGHSHEVQLPDGVLVMTGPPITLGEMPEQGASAPEVPEIPEKRNGAKRGGGTMPLPHDDPQAEIRAVEDAIRAGDPGALPPHAKAVWRRMYDSALVFYKSTKEYTEEEVLREATNLGWRGVLQKYGMPVKSLASAEPATTVKSIQATTLEREEAGAYVVQVAGSNSADVLYERTEQRPLKSAPGASVLVGLSPHNHWNILSVRVPKRLVTAQPGGVGAVEFVRRKWDEIYRIGKGEDSMFVLTRAKRAPQGGRFVPFVGFGGRTVHGRKFVTDPRQATRRIAYGIAYPAFAVDLQGEYANEKRVEGLAYSFMKGLMLGQSSPGEMHARWVMPDGTPAGYPVESFLVRRGDPDFDFEGDWVVATEFHPHVWKRIEDGELLGYSIGGRWDTTPIMRRAA